MRYLLGFIGVIGLVILVVVLIIRSLTGGEDVVDGAPLTDYAHTNVIMRLTMEEEVNNDQNHQTVRITVSRSESRIEILQGYQKQFDEGLSFPNNSEAYGAFLQALDLLNFDRGTDVPNPEYPRGFCPEGELFTYEILDGNSQLQNYWQTSCGAGNFRGEAGEIEDIFRNQIPGYRKFVQDVDI